MPDTMRLMPLHWFRDDDGRPIVPPIPPEPTPERMDELLAEIAAFLTPDSTE